MRGAVSTEQHRLMWLGIDLGTSSVKAVLVDDAGTTVAAANVPLPISRPHPGWSEQNPEDWWQAVQNALADLPGQLRAAVRGIGLSGQMHGAVLVDAQDRVLRPAILWNDGRASAECRLLETREPDTSRITGNRAMPGFTAPKLLWVAANEPDIFGRIAKVLLPKDYLRLRLTGCHASDMSDSAGTLWLDVALRKWSDAMLGACGLDESQMPELFEGNVVTAALRPDVAARLGLPVVPVAGGGGDNAAGAIGVGAVNPGDGFLSLGTSGVIFAVSDGYCPNTAQGVHSFCHAIPDRWHQMAVTLSAASAIDWIAGVTGFASVAEALSAAQSSERLTAVPVFLPYLSGERTPHNDPDARGVLFGLSHDSDPAALVQAVLEGVAFAFADGADALRAAGTTIDRLTLIGGGGRSTYWAELIATVTGCALDIIAEGEAGPALGAARLARLAITGEGVDAVCVSPALLATIAPSPALADRLGQRKAVYRQLYADVRPLFGAFQQSL